MTDVQAFILGLIQGLTEFFPVSSSTHLAWARRMMGLQPDIFFDLICHAGTLFALLTALWKDAWKVLTNIRAIALFSFALLPLIPAYFLFKPLRLWLANDAGYFLFATAAFMFLASSRRVAVGDGFFSEQNRDSKWRDVLWIGIAQSMALLPGISRSAATISTARLLGWEWKDAARFSFLLSVPAIAGGSVIESLQTAQGTVAACGRPCLIGFGTSFITGVASIRLLFWMLDRGSLKLFAWYCLTAAAVWLGLR